MNPVDPETPGVNPFNSVEFFRGPYALTSTDYSAYDCHDALCPFGQDPNLPNSKFLYSFNP